MAGAQPEQPLQSLLRRSSTCCRALTDRVVDGTPTLDGFDMAVHRGEVRAHRHDRYVAPPCIAPRRDIARPLVVPATVLLDRLEAEFIVSPSELDKLGLDPRLDLHRLGLSPAREQESVPDPGCPVVCGLAETSQPDRDLPFRARQYPGSVDPVVGVLMLDHRLFPQIQTIHVRSGGSSRNTGTYLAATRSQITRRDGDRELQTEQRIVGLPARKLQPDRMDARSGFGMTFAKGRLCGVLPAVRFRRI